MRDALEFFYERELEYIRNMGAEFARQRPKIAQRLLLDADGSQDPHVERLIEAFAFLTARVRLKLEDEFPELTDAVLGALYPHYLSPIPSMSIVQFVPDPSQGQLTSGHTIARHTQLTTPEVRSPGHSGIRCRFRTAYPVTLWPLEVRSARFQTAPFGISDVPASASQAAGVVRIELGTLGGTGCADLEMDRIRFYLSGDEHTTHLLYELLLNHTIGIQAASSSGPPVSLPLTSLQPVGFGRDQGLLPYGSQSFLGYRLLTEYFAFPQKFFFVDVIHPDLAAAGGAGEQLELRFYVDRADELLESRVRAETFRLGCCPAVNLFGQEADPIRLTHQKIEYHVIPDVRHAREMEVCSVNAVHSTDLDTGRSTDYEPMYAYRHGRGSRENEGGAYWQIVRKASARENDPGSEVYLSLVDLAFDPHVPAAEVLSVSTTCSNRDLPEKLRERGGEQWTFQLEGQAPLKRIVPLVLPTASLRFPTGQKRWRLISHLALNHLSITDGENGAEALREILSLYDYRHSPTTAQQITGITDVASRRKTARVGGAPGSGFCRGVEVALEFDPEMYVGSGYYLFASVLDRFLGLYASINSFTRLVTKRKGEALPFKQWPVRSGEKTLV